jgi:hypothetical protein
MSGRKTIDIMSRRRIVDTMSVHKMSADQMYLRKYPYKFGHRYLFLTKSINLLLVDLSWGMLEQMEVSTANM